VKSRSGTVKTESIHIESRTDRLIAVREFVSASARKFGFSDEEVSKIALAVDEACTNVIKHAYKFDPTKEITITIKPHGRTFEVAIKDNGKQFNPSEVLAPDMKEYLTHYRRGGLGIYLMKSLMDKVEYDIVPGKKNEVRLIKYLPQ
jgi:serine/threonine-protein kinase RsbW